MALTAYCKKCGMEVEPGEVCVRCGSRLGKNAAHAVWCVGRHPVADWMSWNAVMRVLLPAALAVALLVVLAEGLAGGINAVEMLFRSGFPVILLILLAVILLLVFIALLLQGKELADYVMDSRGIHETRYLPNPTVLKLLARLKSPALLRQADRSGKVSVLKLAEKDIAWKDVARVQLWPEKCMVLIYAPRWWLRLAVVCTPFSWEDAMEFIRGKLGKKKKVLLPPSLMVETPPATRRTAKSQPRLVPEVEEAIEQIRMEELAEQAAMETPDEPPAVTGE